MLTSHLKNFFALIMLSFYSKDFYFEVARSWRHWGLKLLLRFSLFVAALVSIILFTGLASIDFDRLKPWLATLPILEIVNNQAQLENPETKLPFYLKYQGNNKDFIIIDLEANNINKYTDRNAIIFSKNGIVLSQVNNISISYEDLSLETNIKLLNSDNIIMLLKNIQAKILGIILFLGVPVGSLLYFISVLARSFFYAALARMVAKLLRYELSFQQLIRLAIVANIPAFFITLILMLLFFTTSSSMIARIVADNIYLSYFSYIFIECGRNRRLSS